MATDKYIWETGDLIVAACVTCKHKRSGATCAAFPGGIPAKVLDGSNRHTEPTAGDNGIQFEPKVPA